LQLKDALIHALRALPPDFVVGFIVFGSSVRVYRLNHEREVMHADVLGGRACPTKEQLNILSKQVRVPLVRVPLYHCGLRVTGAHRLRLRCHECTARPYRLAEWQQRCASK
jgi:hypothetical protein